MTLTYTVGQLVDDTLEHLLGTTRQQINILAANLSVRASDYVDTLTLQNPLQGAVPGASLSVGDLSSSTAAEVMTIIATSPGQQTCQVLRAQRGSTAQAWASGTVIEIDPPWPRWSVSKTLRDELRSWGPQVFQVKTAEITAQAQLRGYDLGAITPFFRVLDVLMTPPPTIGNSNFVYYPSSGNNDNAWIRVPFHEDHLAPISAFPSGSSLTIESTVAVVPGVLHVIYAAPFDVDTSWTENTDLIGNVGLDTSDLDIPCYGAAWRLLSFREIRRTFTQLQGQARDAQEVPALAIAQAAQSFKQTRDTRLADAMFRLANQYPVRMSVF